MGIVTLSLVVGCESSKDTLQPISPAEAKAAVVAFVNDNPAEFIGKPSVKMLEASTLTDMQNGSYKFGAFTVMPVERRYWMSVDVGDAESYWYEGSLMTSDGFVIATPPTVTRYTAAIDDPSW